MTHPLVDGRIPAQPSLPFAERALTFVAAHTAAGQTQSLGDLWSALPAEAHVAGVEAVLQTVLFAGFPRAINAISVLREIGIAADVPAERGDESTWRQSGADLCRAVYGAPYERLRDRMRALHPDLDRWMIEIGYGRILSRAGLTPRLRELCVLAVLAGQNVPPQLESHLRGALRVGASRPEVDAVVNQTAWVWGESALDQTLAVWRRCTPS